MNEQIGRASEKSLPEYPRNLACLIERNTAAFPDNAIYQEVYRGAYRAMSWTQFRSEVAAVQAALTRQGLRPGDRVAIASPNRKEMLVMELALMAMGAVAVPIFAGYPKDKAASLIEFCEPKFVVVADQNQYDKIGQPGAYQTIVHFDPIVGKPGNLAAYGDLISGKGPGLNLMGEELARETVCLMMYTSGTMGKPKCVQLTHGNILSQQAAMQAIWPLNSSDRFLSYLPWHHSFGGIYEKYSALYNGAVLSLEHGFGKDIDLLIENWRKVLPTVFFSVPKVYQELITKVMQDPALEEIIFHKDLKFIFTAAAPLPGNISKVFAERGIPIFEGWGLTETSPCCTVTDPSIPREAGIVGQPIPGVELRLRDDGEIMVKGPNVMTGYYNNPEETNKVLVDDGWFATGDVGELTEAGLRLISRKDRIFKLTNAEKVIPTEIENLVVKDCPYLSHAYVSGTGRDFPVILLFPNKKMFSRVANGDDSEECICPDGLPSLAGCLGRCLKKMNDSLDTKYSCVGRAMLIDHELTIENDELTPSMKLAPNLIGRIFKANIDRLYSDGDEIDDEKVFVIEVDK